jgi:hypothetical protein
MIMSSDDSIDHRYVFKTKEIIVTKYWTYHPVPQTVHGAGLQDIAGLRPLAL